MNSNIIALGADHGGFVLKEYIKKYLSNQNTKYIDFGTNDTSSADYPIYAKDVSLSILEGKSNLGILCCGTGIGMSIAANKFLGIRAAVCNSKICAEMARRHNNANILCLGGRLISENEALSIVQTFINTPFDGGRHQKRLNLIHQFEVLKTKKNI